MQIKIQTHHSVINKYHLNTNKYNSDFNNYHLKYKQIPIKIQTFRYLQMPFKVETNSNKKLRNTNNILLVKGARLSESGGCSLIHDENSVRKNPDKINNHAH